MEIIIIIIITVCLVFLSPI